MRGGECTLEVSEICGEPVTPKQCHYGADCEWVKVVDDAFDKAKKEIGLLTQDLCKQCNKSPCPMNGMEKDFIDAVGCMFQKEGK